MSVRRNTIANYTGQGYIILIGIIVTPLYLQYLGAEAYGLVGFFALMQAWMTLLDLGLSPTLGRQVALARGREGGFEFFKCLLRSFEWIFLGLAVLIAFGVFVSAEWISTVWVKAETIDREVLIYTISLMGLLIAFRWFAGLYRSGINGLEDQVWLNGANIILATLKFVGALVLLAFITQNVTHFFEYQLFVGVVEVAVLAIRFYRRMPETKIRVALISFDWFAVKSVAPYAMGIAYTAGLWILVTQTDKLILSGVLSLSEYGYFSLVALLAGGITALSGPISQAIMPRMTLLLSQGRQDEMLDIYRRASEIVTLISFSVAVMIGLFAEMLIYAWTGDREAADWGADILIWFALGNGVLSIAAFQYYLQTAFGQLKLHVVGTTISGIIQIPVIYCVAIYYGALGVSVAWFLLRVILFFIWSPLVHHRFVPGFHLNWITKNIFPVLFGVIASASLLYSQISLNMGENRMLLVVQMVLIGLAVLVLSAPFSSYVRTFIKVRLSRIHA